MKAERPRIAVRVEAGRLVPFDILAQEAIDKLPLGRLFIEIDTEEPTDRLRGYYMAGIKILYDSIPESGPGKTFPTETHLRRHLMRATGFAEPIHRIDGIKMEARSMARGAMEVDEMETLLELSRTYTFERWSIDPWALWDQEHEK